MNCWNEFDIGPETYKLSLKLPSATNPPGIFCLCVPIIHNSIILTEADAYCQWLRDMNTFAYLVQSSVESSQVVYTEECSTKRG